MINVTFKDESAVLTNQVILFVVHTLSLLYNNSSTFILLKEWKSRQETPQSCKPSTEKSRKHPRKKKNVQP